MENAERVEKAKEKRLRAKEKALRNMAQIAFLAAGGARGAFAREWLSVFLEEVRALAPWRRETLNHSSATGDQLVNEHDHRDDQQQMDQATSNVADQS